MANASWVGIARAYLQGGNLAQAAAAADSVPAGFNYNLNYIDDLSQRFRLANRMWFYVPTAAPSLWRRPGGSGRNSPLALSRTRTLVYRG